MGIEQIALDVYRIGMGYVSAYLIAQDEVTVIDTGLPKHREIILKAASQARRKREDVKHILLTHHHADHTGSIAELMAATNARAYIHPLDAAIIRGDKPAPGPNRDILAGRILGPLMVRITPKLQPIEALQETNDGDEVPAAGGMKAIHTPGTRRGTSRSSGRRTAEFCSREMRSRTCFGDRCRRWARWVACSRRTWLRRRRASGCWRS